MIRVIERGQRTCGLKYDEYKRGYQLLMRYRSQHLGVCFVPTH
ncbi:hypothetical protein FORC066_2745 [Yersinia enterocolitica]|nr:hypothetical protein FORC065_1745 [Yersinia enterocolitica]UXD29954.1 hypothetical protein FORC066_2745 [Yersinia enterocolitica]